jgi:1-acyl-sn-glycerol-3-phosphate acyltransferase
MNDKKRPTEPPPRRASNPPVGAPARPISEPEATERLLRAEGADGPQHGSPRRRRRHSRTRRSSLRNGPASEPSDQASRVAPADGAGPLVGLPVDLPSDPDIAARIRDLEGRLDSMIVAHTRDRAPSQPPPRLARSDYPPPHRAPSRSEAPPPLGGPARSDFPPPASRPALPSGAPPPASPQIAAVRETARDLLTTDFYLRQWGRLGLRSRSEEVDEFGYDPVYEQRVLPVFEFLYDKYFRVEVYGAEHVPREGRCLLVANHSGVLPVDGMMLRLAVRREHPDHRDVRWLAEDAIFHFPFLGSFTNRVGAVRACQENAERLLGNGSLVAVFPEGMKGIGKLFRERYKLQRFGRGGFVKLCLRTRTPIVPVAIVGSEETNPMLARIEYLTKALGIPYLPVTPTFPLLGPLGILPAPTKWKIFFGPRIALDTYGPEATDDEILVARLAEGVRAEIQSMLDRAIAERRSVWFG